MKIILHGASGRMGKMMSEVISASEGDITVALVSPDYITDPDAGTYNSISECNIHADCIVDFSTHSATPSLLKYAVNASLPLVIATTGHTDAELSEITAASKSIPIFFASNMSIGVAVLIEMAKKAAAAFPDADIEIIEAHHNQKLDAPSGTAKTIFEAIGSVRERAWAKFGRHGLEKRTKDEIGIHSIRAASIVGRHEVIIAASGETLTLTHEAHDRSLFANGALTAAHFIGTKAAGLYSMPDMIGN